MISDTAVADRLRQVAHTVFWLIAAFVIISIIMGLSNYSVTDVFSGSIQGAITAKGATSATVRWATPLFLIAIGVVVAFRAGFFNIGAQGQFYVGSCAAISVALGWREGPTVLVLLAGFLAAVATGAAWSLIPGFLRVRFGTDEVITTLMMSFIATLLLQYLTGGPLRNPLSTGTTAATERIEDNLRITDSSGVGWKVWIILAISAVLAWVLLERTRFGLQVQLSGRNATMARWQGINVRWVGLISFLIAGAMAGLAGAVEVFGPAARITAGFSPSVGFTAIVVALVGLLSVPGVAISALFFGGLQAAILYLPIVSDLPSSALVLLNGTVALLVTIRVRSARRKAQAKD